MADLPAGPAVDPLTQAVLYHRDPLGVLRRARARYGPVFTLRQALKGPLVVVADPEALQGLLGADPSIAHAGQARRTILPQASPRSPFGADGEQHRSVRAAMAPAFAPAAMAALEPQIAALTAQHVAGWPTGRPFRLLPRMRTLASDIFVRLVLAVEDDERATQLVAAVRRLLLTPGNPPTPVPGEGDGALGAGATKLFERREAPITALIGAELADRRARGGVRDDVLGGMLVADPGASAEQVTDALLVVLAAAQEPPAIALANVVMELARRPGLAARFAGEDDGSPVQTAMVAEVLRLRPSAQAALRTLTKPARIDEHELAPGTVAMAPSLLLHRDPVAFPDPERFEPERFRDGTPPGAPYLPFGGGARACLGQPLAEAQFRAVLPTVLRHLRLEPVGGVERMVVRGTVLVPHRSALVRAARR